MGDFLRRHPERSACLVFQTGCGRGPIRNALYMATLTAMVHNPVIARFYQRLKAAGKPSKVAIVACMRK